MLPERMLTKAEYARFLDVSSKTLDVWRTAGKLREGEDYVFLPSGRTRFFHPAYRDELRRAEAAKLALAKAAQSAADDRREGERTALDKRLRATYGITITDYERLLEAQGGRCAICQQEAPLLVDHDHESRAVRGLLCKSCNVGIGFLGDTASAVQRAARYLAGQGITDE